MKILRDRANEVVQWYAARAKPFLQQHVAEHEIETLDKQGHRLQSTAARASEDVTACFLGHAGVGKSTLINALVSDKYSVLPQGGVGPLTAQATLVRYASEPFFRATYFDTIALRKVYLILEKAHDLATRGAGGAADVLAQETDASIREEVEEALETDSPDGETTGKSSKLEANQRQARLLLQGNQYGDLDLPYLIDGIRAALGLPPRLGRTLTPEDAQRVEGIRKALSLARKGGDVHRERRAENDLHGFLDELRDHASRYLAPLIKRLDVGWNAESLANGLLLVDLPGIGVALDEYRAVTTEFVRNRSRVVVVVVDRAGVTVDTVKMLRDTGFFANLLHSSYDPAADPVTLAVAVVKLDLTANDDWQNEKSLQGSGARKWGEHFRATCERANEFVRHAMRQQLQELVNQGPEENRSERQASMEAVLSTMQVYPVSASEFRKLALNDDEDRPRIKSAEESNIPQMRAALDALAVSQRDRARQRSATDLAAFAEHIRAKLTRVKSQWEGESRAEREARQLGEELDAFLAPRRRELDSRQGAFREFLRLGVPAQIEGRVSEATLIAQRDIERYLRKFETMHWARLRASVRKGGRHETYGERHVDLPTELALRFEEPVAVVWSKYVVQDLRTRTKQLGEDYVMLVGEVVEWARGQAARVQPRFLEALHADLTAQTKELASVGKHAVDDLKKAVQEQLGEKLEQQIRSSCERFVKSKKDVGPGVKQRILEHFRGELSASVLDAAQPVARRVLLAAYEDVAKEIGEAFASLRDPLQSARDALIESHEDSVRRSDAKRRKQVLIDVEALLSDMPEAAR